MTEEAGHNGASRDRAVARAGGGGGRVVDGVLCLQPLLPFRPRGACDRRCRRHWRWRRRAGAAVGGLLCRRCADADSGRRPVRSFWHPGADPGTDDAGGSGHLGRCRRARPWPDDRRLAVDRHWRQRDLQRRAGCLFPLVPRPFHPACQSDCRDWRRWQHCRRDPAVAGLGTVWLARGNGGRRRCHADCRRAGGRGCARWRHGQRDDAEYRPERRLARSGQHAAQSRPATSDAACLCCLCQPDCRPWPVGGPVPGRPLRP